MIKAAARGRLPPAAGCGYTVLMMVVATNDAVFRFQLIRQEQLAVVKPGRVMFEIGGIAEETAREAMRLAANKLPIKCKFVKKEETEVEQ